MALTAGITSLAPMPADAGIIFSGNVTDALNPREIRVGPNTTGSLTIDNGSVLDMTAGTSTEDGVHLFFGRNPGSFGSGLIDGAGSAVNIIGSDNAGQANLTASFAHIGRGGNGALTIRNGGKLTITDPFAADGTGIEQGETLMVGRDDATGSLVLDNGSVALDSKGAFVQAGRNGGNGTIVLQNGSTMLVRTRDAAGGGDSHITLGRDNGGFGSMLIQDSQVTVQADNTNASVLIGRDDAASTGVLTVTGAASELNITGPETVLLVGDLGQATMTATDGAHVELGGDNAELIVGYRPGSSGNLLVANGATIDVGEGGGYAIVGSAYNDLGLPESGTGFMTITGDGSRVTVADDVEIGAPLTYGGGNGNGTVIVSDGGRLEADNVLVGVGGLLAGNGTVAANIHVDGGAVAPDASPGTMDVDGDLLMTEGDLYIEIAGLGAGQYDIVRVTGAATLTGGSIHFQFLDFFLPTAGDSFNFLTALGPLTIEPTVDLFYTGLAPGFLFDVSIADSGLLFTALNDGTLLAVPEPTSLALFLSGLAALLALAWRSGRPAEPDGIAPLAGAEAR